MTQFIRRALVGVVVKVVGVLFPPTGGHRTVPVPCTRRGAVPEPRRTVLRVGSGVWWAEVVDGDATRLVRPYVAACEVWAWRGAA